MSLKSVIIREIQGNYVTSFEMIFSGYSKTTESCFENRLLRFKKIFAVNLFFVGFDQFITCAHTKLLS